jgi:antitoxin Phd
MDFSIESLMPYDEILNDSGRVFSVVDKMGKVLLLKGNMPAYFIIKYDSAKQEFASLLTPRLNNHTLQEAMRIVLSDAKNMTMHASALADEIFARGLYLQKNGEKARYTQVRARCGHYPKMFEALPKNFIRLRESER